MQEAEDAATALVWPDNWIVANVFAAMGTQWRTGGFGGLIGLDYGVLRTNVLPLLQVPRSEWTEVFLDLRVMEGAALDTIREVSERMSRRRR